MLTEQKRETVVNFYIYNGSSMIWTYGMMVPVIFQLQSRIAFSNELNLCNHFICKKHFGRTSREMLSLTAILYQFKTYPLKYISPKGAKANILISSALIANQQWLYSDYYGCTSCFELCKSQIWRSKLNAGSNCFTDSSFKYH